MARTAECAAPEGSRDRDEWMTVIEMQEYMRASRNKAYDLIWSGEIDSYRLGRKLDWQPFSGHFFQRLRPAFLNSTGLM